MTDEERKLLERVEELLERYDLSLILEEMGLDDSDVLMLLVSSQEVDLPEHLF